MFLANLPALLKMYTDLDNLRFVRKNIHLLKKDPYFSYSRYLRLLLGAAKGERIITFKNKYVITSYVPYVPSPAFLTFLRGFQNEPLKDLAWVRRSAPLSTHIAITDQCTYDCPHCSAKLRKTGSELTTDQWINVMRQIQDLGVAYIGFTGGEPLMRSDIEAIITSVDERSLCVLYTNGKLLSARRARSLYSAGLRLLSVSLDSVDPDTHNQMHADPNAYAAALKAIQHARKAGLYTIVQAVVFKRELSRKKLLPLFRLVKKHGAHEVRLHQPVSSGRLLERDQENVLFSDDDRKKLFQIQSAANRALWGMPKVSSFPYTEGPDKFGCTAGVLHSYITAQGDFCPCDFIPLSFGNVLDTGVKTLYAKMREAVQVPHLSCWAIQAASFLKDKELPLDFSESRKLCATMMSHTYPQFYQSLR